MNSGFPVLPGSPSVLFQTPLWTQEDSQQEDQAGTPFSTLKSQKRGCGRRRIPLALPHWPSQTLFSQKGRPHHLGVGVFNFYEKLLVKKVKHDLVVEKDDHPLPGKRED